MPKRKQLHELLPEQLEFPLMTDFLNYLSAIQGRSILTIKEYRYDLILFFRHWRCSKNSQLWQEEFNNLPLNMLSNEDIKSISLNDLYAFIGWLTREKKASTANRSRKIATLRSFFKYAHTKARVINQNPAQELESPKQIKRQPKFLEIDESKALLQSAAHTSGQFSERDYCIITLFLNCGLRLAELCSINIDDIRGDTLKVLGKGGKERTVYLNAACLSSLEEYLPQRHPPKSESENALFISRQGNRLSREAVQLLVKNYMLKSGLDASKYSTHKLRHTAATLMYKYGRVDIRLLQQILGHASVSTTEIYTHIDAEGLHHAVESNPLAGERFSS